MPLLDLAKLVPIEVEDADKLFICFPKYSRIAVMSSLEELENAQRSVRTKLLLSEGITKAQVEEAQRFMTLELDAAKQAYTKPGETVPYMSAQGRVFCFVQAYEEREGETKS